MAFSLDPSDTNDPNWDIDPNNFHRRFTMTDPSKVVHILEETTVERDLGVYFNNRLNWQRQINHVKAKAYTALGNLKRTFLYWTPQTFKLLYVSYVRPHLEFCSTVWNPHNEHEIASLERVQRDATKIIPSIRSLPNERR